MAATASATLQLLHEFQQVQAKRAELYARFNSGFRDFLGHGQEGVFARLMQEVTPGFTAVSQQVIHIESCLRSSAVDRPDLAGLLRQVQELERNKLKLTLSWQALRAAHATGRFSWQSEADRPRLSSKPSPQQQQQQQQLLTLLDHVQLEQSQRTTPAAAGGAARAAAGDDVHAGHDDQKGQVEGFMSVKPGFYEQQLRQATAAAAAASAREQGGEAVTNSSSSAAGEGHEHSQQHSQHQHHGCCGHHGHDHGPPDPLESNPLEPSEAEYTAAVREALQELDACVTAINEVLEEVRDAVAELQEDAE